MKNKFFLLSITLCIQNMILTRDFNTKNIANSLLNQEEDDYTEKNSIYYENLRNNIMGYIFFLVDFLEDIGSINKLRFDDILYIKNKNLLLKKDLSVGDIILPKDFCVMYKVEIYNVLSFLYNFIPVLKHLSYWEAQGIINRNSSQYELNSQLNKQSCLFQVPDSGVNDNFFGKCLQVTKKMISWLHKNYIID